MNTNGNPNEATDKSYFCPSCSSANVTASSLAGGAANCNICTWKGVVEDLAVYTFQHGMGGPEQVLHNFAMDVRRVVSGPLAVQMVALLAKWGFLSSNDMNPKVAARYLGAMARGMAKSLLEEREKMEKENHGQQPG